MMNYNNKEFAYKSIRDLVNEGLKQMRDPNLDENIYRAWVSYSQKILEITTQEYNPTIVLNYLRVISNISSQALPPFKKIGLCLDYLIGVLRILGQ